MDNNFIKYFIENELYIQNCPINEEKFIELAKKRGLKIDENILEILEKEGLLIPIMRFEKPTYEEEMIRFIKDGQEYCRAKNHGLQNDEKLIKEYSVKRYGNVYFDDNNKEYLITLIYEGLLYSPNEKGYEEWKNFNIKELGYKQKIKITFYSNFQIY